MNETAKNEAAMNEATMNELHELPRSSSLAQTQAQNSANFRPLGNERGFTLLELIVVVSVLGILAAIALPNFIGTPPRAREAVLKTNLHTLRTVIDQYYADQGTYPPTLDSLAEEGYIRDVPFDPITESQEWGLIYDQEGVEQGTPESELGDGGGAPGIIDVYSLSEGTSVDGEAYADW